MQRVDPAARGAAGTLRTALNVLLVEDDATDADALRERLAGCRGARFRVTRAQSLGEALERLKVEKCDLVLLDLQLPDTAGIETCERFLASAAGVPFIVLTGMEDEVVGVEAVKRGAQDFLVKGALESEVLGRALRYAVERHAMLVQLDHAAREAVANEAKVRRLLEGSIEGLVVVDGAGVVRFANRSAQVLLGRPGAQVVGSAWASLADADPQDSVHAARELLLARPHQPPIPVEARTLDVEWEGTSARLVSLLDLTDRRRAESIAVAHRVQRAFLPERAGVRLGTLEASALNELCEDASGDFYDFFPLADGRLVVAVGDVAGHGLGAALLMCQGRAFLRALCLSCHDPVDVMERMNDALDEVSCPGGFLTLFLAFIEPETGTLEWSSAGHVPALLRRARTGHVEHLRATGPPLWVMRNAPFQEAPPTRLEEGDILLLYTDGATEAAHPDGRQYGLERLCALLCSRSPPDAPGPPSEILADIRSTLRAWTGPGPLHDDLTLVAVRHAPAGDDSSPPGSSPSPPPNA